MAWLFICLLPGAPCIYYGDEVGLPGRHDPDCRRGFPWNEEDQDRGLREWYQQCISWRAAFTTFRRGNVEVHALSDEVIALTSDGNKSQAALFNIGDDLQRVDLRDYTLLKESYEVPPRSGVICDA